MADAHGIEADFDVRYHVFCVRYFDAAGVGAVGRLRLPQPLRFVAEGDALLVWRSPTESLFLTRDNALAEALESQWRDSPHGCCVLQSDGICIVRLAGLRLAELLQRMGAAACVPTVGEACTSRIGDLAVTAIGVGEHDVLLAVERVYAAHLEAWIESTLADF